MKKIALFTFILFMVVTTYAQKKGDKLLKGRFEIGYTILTVPVLNASDIPGESFHTSKYFNSKPPFIHPDEPDNYVFIRYVFNREEEKKLSFCTGLEYLHTKPNRFDKDANELEGLYLANGYTQLGLGLGLYYKMSKLFLFNTTLSSGPMFSNPNWKNKEYTSYKGTSFLAKKYQITGWGFTNNFSLDMLLGKRFVINATFILHFDKSRELRATDGTKGSFHSFSHSFGIGGKIRL